MRTASIFSKASFSLLVDSTCGSDSLGWVLWGYIAFEWPPTVITQLQ